MNEIGVYKAIAAVQAELATVGIGKGKTNTQQGYKFRGIDDVYDVLAPVLAKHGLCILPRVLARTFTERQAKSGGVLFSVIVECEFDLVSAEDGSKHTIRTFGEAMDSADKGTNKAMSAAYKYAAFQTFCIPVDVEDADAITPEVKGKKPEPQKKAPPPSPTPPVSTDAEKGEYPEFDPPARAVRAAPADDEVIGLVTNIEAKDGETKGKKWKLFAVTVDGERYKTFSDTFADMARTAKDKGSKVRIKFRASEKGKSIALLTDEEATA